MSARRPGHYELVDLIAIQQNRFPGWHEYPGKLSAEHEDRRLSRTTFVSSIKGSMPQLYNFDQAPESIITHH